MQTLKSFLDQSILIWKDSTAAARFGIILLLLICVGAIAGVGFWSSQPYYVTLASGLDHNKSSQLMAALDSENIKYDIKGAGSIIQVDKRSFEKATVLAGNVGVSSSEPNLETASPWMDPVNQQNVFRRNLERQLANSIEKFATIDAATVHLSIPAKQPFLRSSVQPTASVILGVASNTRFSEAQSTAIASLVANAVPGLRVDQVAISDTSGNVYASDESLGRLTQQEEYRLNRERELTNKAQAMLVNFLGVGNSRVEVTADFSFPEGKTVSTEYDPDGRVVTSETIDSSSTVGENPAALGAAGTANNVGNPGRGGNKTVTSKTETLESKYEVSSMTREDVVRTPVLNLLTISVLVNSDKVQNEAKEIPDTIRKSIESLVKQAVGFRDSNDQFNIEFFEFVDMLPIEETPAAAFPWDKVNNILKNISLGVAALVALFLGLRAFKNLQPAPSTGGTAAATATDRVSQISQLSEMVKENPEVFNKIIAAWASDSGSDEETTQPQSEAA
jgi:flagellar M-ring protein FliF